MTHPFLALLILACGLGPGSALARDTGTERTRPKVLGFDITARGDRVDLLLTVRDGEAITLRHRRSADGGATWSAGHEVDLGARPVHPPGPGSEPQIATKGDWLLVIWTTLGTSRWGSGPLVGALSADLGQTWAPAPSPASTGSTDAHGEVDLLVVGDRLHAVWLDNRDGLRGLRAALSNDFGRSWQPEQTVDPTTCTCCWNRLARGPDGRVYVIYRDAEPRDLTLAGAVAGRWQRLGRPAGFDWQLDGCPSVGGALAWTSSGTLHALTWTGQQGAAGLYVSRSHDRGQTFIAPVRLGQERAHRGDLAARGVHLMAAWDAYVDEGKAVFAARSRDQGQTWSAPERLSGLGASMPRIVALERGFRVFWLDPHQSDDWASTAFLDRSNAPRD